MASHTRSGTSRIAGPVGAGGAPRPPPRPCAETVIGSRTVAASIRELVRMKCSVGVSFVLVVIGVALRHGKARGFPQAEPTGDVRDIREALGLQQAGGNRRARPALAVHRDRR